MLHTTASTNLASTPSTLGPVFPAAAGPVPAALAGRVLGPVVPGVRVGPYIPVYGDHR